MILFAFLFYGLACALPSHVVVQREADSVASGAHVRIDLHSDLMRLFPSAPPVKRVLWCRSLVPQDKEATITARAPEEGNLLRSEYTWGSPQLNACSSPGLIRMQIYPGSSVAVRQPRSDPYSITIDTDAFWGAWDTKHRMEVIVEMHVNDTCTARHVSRFNAETRAAATAPDTPNHQHPWGGMALLFFGGGAAMACVAAVRMYGGDLERFVRRRVAWVRGNRAQSRLMRVDEGFEDDDAVVMMAMGHGRDEPEL